MFSITDLFVVGLGLELVGAWLIARGLLIPLPALKAFGTYGGIGTADVVDRARNRVDGQFGVTLLLLGFALQLLGYLLELDGDHARGSQDRFFVALVLLGLSMFAAVITWHLLRDRLFKRTLVKLAMAPLRTSGIDIEQTNHQNIAHLAKYGDAAGWQLRMYESDETYVARVFGLTVKDEDGNVLAE